MKIKNLISIYSPQESHWVGDGFDVSTLFSPHQIDYHHTSPFILMDYAAPKFFPASDTKRGVGVHPHRGFETVTFAIQGEIEHRDSGGGGGTIKSGGIQWMTAGSGVVHEEFHSRDFTRKGGTLEMVQLWVNLSKEHKMTKPRYQSLENSDLKVIKLENHSEVKLVAGTLKDEKGPAQTFSPINIYEINTKEAETLHLKFDEGTNLLILQLRGHSHVIHETNQKKVEAGSIGVFTREGSEVELNVSNDSKILVLNAQPIDEPLATYGPFVMNTREEILQAIEDFQAGKMGTF